MTTNNKFSAFNLGTVILGACIFAGLATLGYLLGTAAVDVKQFERSVTVKGLSEREYPADIVTWPIKFAVAGNDLTQLYDDIEANSTKIKQFLTARGIKATEISLSPPDIVDKTAQQYGNDGRPLYRYSALQTVTVYSSNIDAVRKVMTALSDLGKQGIAFTGGSYEYETEYLFTRLNEVKPEMVEEATKSARMVAEKFASDSDSKLGKIKKASQGRFSISDRDKNNRHIKKVRVVSTVEYYLSD